MLKGKAQELFEKWLYKNPETHKFCYKGFEVGDKIHFYKLSPSMQWGVYQDFAESLGYEINAINVNGWMSSVKSPPNSFISWSKKRADNPQQARAAAIEKFNELVNDSCK